MSNQKNSREQMWSLYNLFLQTNQTQKEFCAAQNIKVHNFQYWRSKFDKEKSIPKIKPSFKEVKPSFSISTQNLRLHCGQNIEVELPSDYPVNRLADLIRQISC